MMRQPNADVSSCPDNNRNLPKAAHEIPKFLSNLNAQATPSQPVNPGEKMGNGKEKYWSVYESHTIFALLTLQFQKGRHPFPERMRSEKRGFLFHFYNVHLHRVHLSSPNKNLYKAIIWLCMLTDWRQVMDCHEKLSSGKKMGPCCTDHHSCPVHSVQL